MFFPRVGRGAGTENHDLPGSSLMLSLFLYLKVLTELILMLSVHLTSESLFDERLIVKIRRMFFSHLELPLCLLGKLIQRQFVTNRLFLHLFPI